MEEKARALHEKAEKKLGKIGLSDPVVLKKELKIIIDEFLNYQEKLERENRELAEKLAEESQKGKDSEKLLNEMGKIARIGGWELDCVTMRQVWTDETYVIHDREKGEYNPNSTEELSRFEPGSKEIIEKAFEAALTKGKPYDLELEMTTIKGNRKWVRAVCSPLVSKGKVIKLTGTLQDITHSKQEEKKLAILAERHKLATQCAGIGIWDWDIAKNDIVWDDRMFALYGLQPGNSDKAFETWLNGLHPDDREAGSRITKEALNAEKEYNTEFRVVWPDGSVHWLKADAQVFRNEKGEAIRMVGLNYDITERKKAELNLKRWADIFENLAFGFVIGVSDSHRLGLMNPAFARMHGYTTEELTGVPIADVFAPECRSDLPENIRMVHEKGHYVWESLHIRKDGTIFPVLIDGVAVKDNEGRILYRIISIQDITERKQAEAAVEASENRFRSLIERSSDGIVVVSAKGEIMYESPSATRLIGFDPKERMNRNSFEHIHPDDLQEAYAAFARIASQPGESIQVEYRALRKDGSTWWAGLEAKNLLLEPSVQGIVINFRDITERKDVYNKLRESEKRFSTIFSDSPVAIALSRVSDSKIILANPAVINLCGYTREEIIGHTTSELGIWPNSDDRQNLIELLKSEQIVEGMETTLLQKSGDERRVQVWGELIQLDGETCIMAEIIDVTDRKLAEEQLLERQAELNNAQRLAKMASWRVDLSNYQLSVSENYKRLIGLEDETIDITFDYFISRVHPDDVNIMNIENYQLTPDSPPFNADFRILMPDGSVKWFQNSMVGEFVKGRLIALKGTNIDITDEKSREQEILELNASLEQKVIERTAQLEAANKAKSEFLANMSHEIRTPMNAILGYTELLGPLVTGRLQQEYLQSIKSSGKGLLTLINDILDLSKIEAGRLEIFYDYVDTDSFFTDFKKIFALKVQEKNLDFNIEIASGTPKCLYIDETRVRQIIFNLLGNAIKFTSHGSVSLNVYTDNPQKVNLKDKTELYIDLYIEITDTGSGISKDQLEEIFKPFVQEADKRTAGGTGLGLPISRRLADLMNGKIEVESELGKGSRFRVKLPEIQYLHSYYQVQTSVEPDINRITFEKAAILIIDDIEHNRKYLADALRDTNFILHQATNGGEGIKIARRILPDLIITDIRMPGLNGFEVLNILKGNDLTRHIPVIAYSASVMKEQKLKILNSEFAGLLIKPVQLSELYSELMKILPYKIKDPVLKKTDHASLASVNNIEELIYALENIYNSSIEKFRVRQPMNEVREFGEDMIKLGTKHNAASVIKYGNDLVDSVSGFNISSIVKLINSYPSIIEELRVSKH